MQVELIKMDPAAARAKLSAYRKAIARRYHSKASAIATAEYAQIAEAYRHAAKGLPLIELTKAMAMGGWDAFGRPRFAIGRADRKLVECDTGGGSLRFWARGQSIYRGQQFGVFRFPIAALPPRTAKDPKSPATWNGSNTISAITPIVPPDVLPRPDCDLSKRVILWEANWREAPGDPLLLLPIGGDLYAVEAAWDLTDLERAVIAGRRS